MTPDQAMARIVEITANLDTYIERRASEIAEPRIAQAETAANERVAEVERMAAFEEQRSGDLVQELRRCLEIRDREIDRMKGANRG